MLRAHQHSLSSTAVHTRTTKVSVPSSARNSPPCRHVCWCSERPARDNNTLSNLDSLLGESESGENKSKDEDERVPWYSIRPQQTAAPRQESMSSKGGAGRFLISEDFMAALNVGQKSALGSQLQVPEAQPFVSYVFLLLVFSCAGTYMNVQAFQGPEGAYEYLLGICSSPAQLAKVGVLHPLLSTFQSPGILSFLVALFALAFVAPRVEAAVGTLTFVSVFLLSGYSGALTSDLLQLLSSPSGSPSATCGASAALLGTVASYAVYLYRNYPIVGVTTSDEASKSSAQSEVDSDRLDRVNSGSSTSGSSSGSGSGASPQQQQGQLALLLSSCGVAAASIALCAVEEGGPAPGIAPLSLLPTLIGGLTGCGMSLGMGPLFYIQREAQIPLGSMVIPDSPIEMEMLLDRTSGLRRAAVAAASGGVLFGVAQVVSLLAQPQ